MANAIAFAVMLYGVFVFFDEYDVSRSDCDYWTECALAGWGAV